MSPLRQGHHVLAASRPRPRAAGEVSREGIEGLLEGEPDAGKVAARIAGAIGIAGSKSAPEETMWAVRRLLEHLARDVPLVIAFDDLQWAEPTFLDLIEYLLGWIATRRS